VNRTTNICTLVAAAVALAGALALLLGAPSRAFASTRQISIIQDASFLTAPATALLEERQLGATTVRVFVQWYSVAPDPASTREPRGFDASNPNAYPAAKWKPYDALVRLAEQDGITVDLELTGGAPRWAEGPNAPATYRKNSTFAWQPNARLYGQFAHAVSERYDGAFTPSGSETPLPAVHFWSFWNEPNFGQDLGPQAVDGSTVPIAPKLYRSLLDAGWTAVHQTQPHARDTVLIGELAAEGYPLHAPDDPGRLPGDTAQTQALEFLRAVYCVSARYRPLTGVTAARYGCPTTTAASRKFRAQNPGLFDATGFADHPYSSKRSPNANPAEINLDYATFPVLNRVAKALDGVTAAYGSRRHLPIYNDEFGYITSPPQPADLRYPSPTRAAAELNEAEYISYTNPRVASYAQYLLDDPEITRTHPKPGFSSGLYTSGGQPKATLAAYELPVWLPKATVRAGSSTEIWGGARPATFASSATTKTAPTVEVQMQKGGKGSWTTIQTVKVSASSGYFDIHTKLPYSGNLRLTYTYPQTEPLLPANVAGSSISGRTVKVTVTG
jgi:hypothetical protein